jgi:hypothetical protein
MGGEIALSRFGLPNKSLVLTAQARFLLRGCLIEAGLVSEVGVKLR